ncbi:MAG: DUF4381 domain-containing protein [Alphaproteobacteria bacterium]|nr:DUF4381 domain-containing protein [Alphaproteobacteria bacterium]
MNNQIDLTPLKGLHVMDQPSWWPLAYGWWIVFVGVVFAVILFFMLRKWWRARPVVYAMHELQKIQKISKDIEYLRALSNLMKRVAILRFGREEIAPLTEDKWQHFLLQVVPHTFSESEAKSIALSPYVDKVKTPIKREKLRAQTAKWIQAVLKNKNSLDKS